MISKWKGVYTDLYQDRNSMSDIKVSVLNNLSWRSHTPPKYNGGEYFGCGSSILNWSYHLAVKL